MEYVFLEGTSDFFRLQVIRGHRPPATSVASILSSFNNQYFLILSSSVDFVSIHRISSEARNSAWKINGGVQMEDLLWRGGSPREAEKVRRHRNEGTPLFSFLPEPPPGAHSPHFRRIIINMLMFLSNFYSFFFVKFIFSFSYSLFHVFCKFL